MSTVELGAAASGDPERLAGMTVLVTGAPRLASKLASGLEQLGCGVATLAPLGTGEGPAARVPLTSRADALEACASAAQQLGGLDALVHAPELAAAGELAFDETDEETWVRCAEAPIWEALVLFQATHATFKGAPGAIVTVIPSVALTGASGLVAVASAAEGIRQLVKSAARAWGVDGTRVNCLTLPIDEWGLSLGQPVPNRYGASLPGPNLASDLAGAVATLISPFGRGVTGATIGLDRGTVMAP